MAIKIMIIMMMIVMTIIITMIIINGTCSDYGSSSVRPGYSCIS